MPDPLTCAGCGRPVSPEDGFCSACGTPVPAGDPGAAPAGGAGGSRATGCHNCGRPIEGGARFCSGCGTAVLTAPSRDGWDAVAERLAAATGSKYEILRLLGRGAMGAVYLARQGRLKREVAIKVIAPALLTDESMVERFRFEAETLASLRHPHITQIYEVSETADLHYFVMEYVDGPSLRTVSRLRKTLPVPVVQSILYQVGTALSHVHSRHLGLVHRDVKPGNIMLDREGNAFVTDFGISKAARAQAGLTMTGMVIGTPEYMSPEQWKGEPLTGSSDQYALGVVAYELICGGAPFVGEPYAVMSHHLSKAPPSIMEARPDCPPELAAAVLRMMAKDPAHRFDDLEEAVVALGGKPLGTRDPIRAQIVGLVREVTEASAAGPGSRAGPAAPAVVELGGVPDHVEPGDSFRLSARVLDRESVELPSPRIRWTSTNPGVAVVHDGSVRVLGTGEVSIVARVGDVEASAPLRVDEPRTAEILITPAVARLEAGERLALGVELLDGRGRRMTAEPAWYSADEAVATVTRTGEVQAHRPGVATVTAEHQGVQAGAAITVEPPQVHAILLDDPPGEVRVGEAVRLSAQCTNRHGQPVDRTVGWSTADPDIATVSGSLLEGLAPGATSVTAQADATTETFGIVVLPGEVAELTLDGPAGPLLPGDEIALTCRAADARGNALDDVEPDWYSSDASVATVEGGRVRAVGPGRAQVTASVDGAEGRATVTVEAVRPAAVSLEPSDPTVEVGQDVRLTAVVLDQRSRPLDATVDWRTDNARVVSLVDGRVRGLAAGSAVVTATAGTAEADVRVQVTPASVRGIRLELAHAELLPGATSRLAAVVADARGNELTGRDVTFRSSNDAVAAVDPDGTVRARVEGRVVFTATCEGQRADVELTVLPAPVDRLVLSTPPLDLKAGRKFALSATPKDASGRTLDRPVTWQSTDPSLARVSSGGTVRARQAGSVDIVVTCDGVEERIPLEIAEGAPPVWRTPAVMGAGAVAVAVVAVAGVMLLRPDPVLDDPGSEPGVLEGPVDGGPEVPPDVGPIVAGEGGPVDTAGGVVPERDPPRGTETDEESGGPAGDVETDDAPASVWTGARTLSVRVGQRLALQAEARNGAGDRLDLPVTWRSSDAAVAATDVRGGAAGVVGRSPGSTTLVASAGGLSTTVALTVTPEAVARVTVSPGTLALDPGQSGSLGSTVTGESGGTLDRAVSWSTTDAGVATVDRSGRVTAVGQGTARIVAEAGGRQADAEVTVRALARPTVSGLSASARFDPDRGVLITTLTFSAANSRGGPWCAVATLTPSDVGSAHTVREPVTPVDGQVTTATLEASVADLSLTQADLRALPRGGYRGENGVGIEVLVLGGTCAAPGAGDPLGRTEASACMLNMGQGDWLSCR